MLKTRLIPVLLLKDGVLVRSESFNVHQVIGDPISEAERFNEWEVDELIYLDISSGLYKRKNRIDSRHVEIDTNIDILRKVSENCFMPLTWGGGIKNIEDVERCILNGADKVAINSCAFTDKNLISSISKKYGSQSIVVCIDVKFNVKNSTYEVYINNGTLNTNIDVRQWSKDVESLGAGEILLQSIDRDGTAEGYDLCLIESICELVSIPVIALGGVGNFYDYPLAIKAGASAASSANIWHFKEFSDKLGKKAMSEYGIDVR